MKTPAILILALVWLGSVGGAYFIGRNSADPQSPLVESHNTPLVAPVVRAPGAVAGSNTGVSPAGQASAEPTEPVDVSALMRKAKIMMSSGGMMNMNAMIDMGALLKTIPYDQIPDALAEAEKITNPQAKQAMMMLLMGRWAEKDGPAALEYAEKLEKESGGGMLAGAGAKMAVLQAWGQRDPDAVWEWYLDQKESKSSSGGMFGGNAMALMGIFNGLVSKDPTEAFERLTQVEDAQSRQMALGGMMQHITDPEVQDALGEYLTSLDDSDRTMATQGVMGQWAMLDPDGMMKFAESRPDNERKSLVKQAGQTLLYVDPDKGIDMILENSDEKELPSSYQMIAQSIAARDPEKAATWLGEQTPGPELDQARTSYAQTVAQQNPESAMTWAKTITDENTRTSTVSSVYKQWHQKDPDAADAALPESGLSAEAVEQLLQEIDTETQGSVEGATTGAAIGGFINN